MLAKGRDLISLLRKVEKPGRYVGGEFGAMVKPDPVLTVALSYPDLYEIGMSNAAIRILYSLLNAIPGVSCERVFAPAPDFEDALRSAGIPLFSLETGRPLSQFDLIGFSVGHELTLTNLCAILESGGVEIERARRGPGQPIVIAGGPAATNPVPLGLFVDAVFIGEAEGWVEPAFTALAENGKAVHNFLSVPFVLGVLLMIGLWIRDNIPEKADLVWLKSLGGLLSKSGKHP